MSRIFTVLIVLSLGVFSSRSADAMGKELITSATYGVLAGTIVGAATLAFSDNPGDNLQRIARGASLGLYAGIALGLYVTYGVPTEEEDEDSEYSSVRFNRYKVAKYKVPRFAVVPVVGVRGFEGAAAVWNIGTY